MTDEIEKLRRTIADQAAHIDVLVTRLDLVSSYEEELRSALAAAHARILESDGARISLRSEIAECKARIEQAERVIAARDEGIRWLREEREGRGRAAREDEPRALRREIEQRDASIALLRVECERTERVLAARDEGIAWLRGELALARQSAVRRIWVRVSARVRALCGRKLAGRSDGADAASDPSGEADGASDGERHRDEPSRSPLADLALLPELGAEASSRVLSGALPAPRRRRQDVVCLPIIDWDFRFQRPQQILTQFAAAGHRVFWISPTRSLAADHPDGFAARWIGDGLCEVELAAERPPSVYEERIAAAPGSTALESLAALRRAFGIGDAVTYVMIASWTDVAFAARERFGWQVVYDCMDEWAHFDGIGRAVVAAEPELVAGADLLVVSAERLEEKWRGRNPRIVLARNGVDVDFYERELALAHGDVLAGVPHPIVGYFGAIADWFDVELVREAAERRPHYSFVLLGGVFKVDVSSLRRLANVRLLGQQPYADMPKYLAAFDACLIPFRRNAVTHATDPVKYYEYLSAGKPVVAVALDELAPHRDDHYSVVTADELVAALDSAVHENDPERVARRKRFARENTWRHRYQNIDDALRPLTSRVSIVVVTYENLALTRLCLESVLANTDHGNYEIIVVDNASRDGTPDYLRHLESTYDDVSVILNPDNRGFPRAVNQGLERGTGDHLVILNNDVVVPPGWLGVLLAPLRDPAIGLVGPMTNFAGNEAKIEVPYTTVVEMERFARERRWREEGRIADINVLAMFCVAMRRDVFAAVGPLDESFGIGMFEDDDYSNRVRKAGFRVVCAADAFVHHVGQAAFKELIAEGTYDSLFNRNRARFEAKWEKPWVAHRVAPLDFRRERRAER